MIDSAERITPSWRWMIKHKAFYACGFGTGLAPKMPGTVGTLPGLVLFALVAGWPLWAKLLLVVPLFCYGVRVANQVSALLGEHDHKSIVCDEIVGVYLVLLWFPLTWQIVLAGFVLFRLFDITKPWPISWCDQTILGGLGIMVDDVAAAVPAFLGLWLLHAYVLI